MMQDVLLTAREAAERLKVNPKAISMWSSKGWINEDGERQHLTVAARNHRGAAQFPWNELCIAERDTRRKTNRSHRRTGYTQCPA